PGPRALRCLAALEEHAGRTGTAAHLRERAAALAENPWPPPGVVRAAAILAFGGKPKGLVHDLIARRIPAEGAGGGKLAETEIHGELGDGVREHIRRTFAAVRESLAARYPERTEEFDRFDYGIHITKEDEPSGGPSLGLPMAVAFASALLQVRVPSDHVFTGALSYDGAGKLTVRQVGELGLKLKATLHAGARMLVLPAMQLEEATAGVEVPRSIAVRSAMPVSSLDDVLARVLGV
ncbi:MAG TPA: S16 family serine protease, partial [Vulgatibacter sp.]